ncbi:integrase arm-type DNA-binding domain-containing protein [Salinispirillum sp. LH 10-3-1]|uniref:Integrase arm-type DNA-binding domain-containing protein n=1 Tax=Salinispirillum sp. LH 10-3-1 TaxID=2952525 RepID=A0AB38YI78_9GAMM
MGRRVVPLTDKQVQSLTYAEVKGEHLEHQKKRNEPGTPRTAYHAVGGEGAEGLTLMCQPPKKKEIKGARSWILRISIDGRQRQLGLGSYPVVTLARAREKAREIRAMVADGIDPLEHKRKARAEREAAQSRLVKFEDLAIDYMANRMEESGARDAEKKISKELNQLKRYSFPAIGKRIVGDLTPNDIAEAVRIPLEEGKRETYNQVRRNITRIMDQARAKGLYHGDNPADLGVLKHLLPTPKGKKKTLGKPQHRPAVMLSDAQRFYAAISSDMTIGARLIQFQLLTASRPGEARHARWADIDIVNRIWHVPAEDMKMGLAHDVPLPDHAVELLATLPRKGEFVFGKRPPSENTASKRLRDLHKADIEAGGAGFFDPYQTDKKGMAKVATPHGLRNTFKEWARSVSDKYRDELSEIALAHQDPNKVRSAYARETLLEERRPMMQDWAQFCTKLTGKADTNVVAIGGRGA